MRLSGSLVPALVLASAHGEDAQRINLRGVALRASADATYTALEDENEDVSLELGPAQDELVAAQLEQESGDEELAAARLQQQVADLELAAAESEKADGNLQLQPNSTKKKLRGALIYLISPDKCEAFAPDYDCGAFAQDAELSMRCAHKFVGRPLGYDILAFHTMAPAQVDKMQLGAPYVKFIRVEFDWPDAVTPEYLADGRCMLEGVDWWAKRKMCGCTCPEMPSPRADRYYYIVCGTILIVLLILFVCYCIAL